MKDLLYYLLAAGCSWDGRVPGLGVSAIWRDIRIFSKEMEKFLGDAQLNLSICCRVYL